MKVGRKKKVDVFARIVADTIYDSGLMNRYVPLQYAQEYRNNLAKLRRYICEDDGKIEVILLIHPKENLIPLVSVITWRKAYDLFTLGQQEECISVSRIHLNPLIEQDEGSMPLNADCACEKVLRAFGFDERAVDISKVIEDLEPNSKPGASVTDIFQRHMAQISDEENRLYFYYLSVILAYCSLHPGRMILCGQDKAPLINTMWKELTSNASLETKLPIALYIPRMPFHSGNHPLLTDPPDVLKKRLSPSFSFLPGRDLQVKVGSDLLRLALGAATRRKKDGSQRKLEEVRNLDELSSILSEEIYLNTHSLRGALLGAGELSTLA